PLATNVSEIPAEIGTLVVIHPKSMSDATQYALDQFVLRGGRLVLFVDPICENDLPPGVPPMQAMQIPRSSSLPRLMKAWGVEMAEGQIAGDLKLGLSVNAGGGAGGTPVTYVAWMRLGAEQRSSSDPLVGQLSEFIVPSPGILSKVQGATTEFTPLLFTTEVSSRIDASNISMFPDPKKILADFKPGGTPLTLAARVTGPATTAFPDGQPKAGEGQEPIEPAKQPHRTESAEPINVLVVADCDLLADRFWTQELSLGGLRLGQQKFSDNADLLIGAVDAFTGSGDLLSLRSRGSFTRPFTRVEAMRKEAEQRYRAKEQELRERLRETERKIAEIQRARPDGKSTVILTPEQSSEIEKFRTDQVAIRTQLREVQYDLRRDIEGLGTRIKALNIAGVPVLVGVFALGLAGYRAGRRRADRRSVGATG
ncbi:MAG: Gldg family protein, partial [Phycisphaerales bacterium]|nr:Gldg family protein [Phycisphaerales bacterium]